MSRDALFFGALSLIIGVIVVGFVGYDIYLHPADPNPVGSATIEISGSGHFRGEVGAEATAHTIEGKVSQDSPVTVEVPFRRADYVVANMVPMKQSSATAEIRTECKTVAEGEGTLIWKVPRSWEPPKCP